MTGLRDGFHTGVQSLIFKSFECDNLRSAIKDPESVSRLLADEKNKGFIIGPYTQSPYPVYRVSPLGVVQHKYSEKKRLVVDLSAPHDHESHPSVNELISKEDSSLSYVKLDEAIRIIKNLGPGSWLNKVDISDAFKQLPIDPALWHLYGIRWQGNLFFYTRLVFGSRSSCKIFDTLSQAVVWIAKHRYGIRHILHLLDDFLVVDSPESIPERSMAVLCLIFNRLAIPLAKHKSVGPVHQLEYLGIILDSVKMEARLPLNKLERMVALLRQFLHKRSCTKRDLLSLIGHLVFACRVVIPGRTFLSRLFSAAKKVRKLHHRVTVTQACKADAKMWLQLLSSWNGVSMFLEDEPIKDSDLHLFTDASGRLGFGGYFQGQWFSSPWPPTVMNLVDQDLSIAFQELYPIVVAAILWGNSWARKRILFHCDNLATVHILNKGRSTCTSIMKLMRRLVVVAATCNFHFLAAHLPGKTNIKADALSRLDLQKFRRLAPEAALHPCCIPTNIMFD